MFRIIQAFGVPRKTGPTRQKPTMPITAEFSVPAASGWQRQAQLADGYYPRADTIGKLRRLRLPLPPTLRNPQAYPVSDLSHAPSPSA
jgi:hypothetical protein